MIVIKSILLSLHLQSLPLVNGTSAFAKWSNIKVPLHIKFYIYNITNPDDFLSGSKPVFKEQGPYVYDQTLTRRIHGWEANETLINYETIKNFKFNRELTKPNSLNDTVTILNFPLLVSTSTLNPFTHSVSHTSSLSFVIRY